MGKLIAAFTLFLAASALAIHEAQPPPRPVDAAVAPTAPADDAPPSRALRDPVPPWVRYAATTTPQPPSPPTVQLATPPSATVIFDGDPVDEDDRCPTEPQADVDDNGCPEPAPVQRPVVRLELYE